MAAETAIDDTTGALRGEIAAQDPRSRKEGNRRARLIATVSLVVLLAILVVRLIFALITPLPMPSATPSVMAEGRVQTDLTIFTRFDPFQGNVPAPEIAPVEQAEETRLNLKLYGTFLGDAPSAIVQGSNNRQGVYFLGDEIAPGVTIREIRPNQILLDRRGALETLTLENRDAIQQSTPVPLRPVMPSPAGFPDVSDFIRIQPDPDGNGVLLFAGRQPQFFEAAGLQNGDRLLAIDSAALTAGGSQIAGLPAKLSQGPVPITIERNGTRLELELELTGLTP